MQEQLSKVVNKYAAVEGVARSSMLKGLVIAYLSSGIYSDGLSVHDDQVAHEHGLYETDEQGDIKIDCMSLFEIEAACGVELECCNALRELLAINEDLELVLDQLDALLDE